MRDSFRTVGDRRERAGYRVRERRELRTCGALDDRREANRPPLPSWSGPACTACPCSDKTLAQPPHAHVPTHVMRERYALVGPLLQWFLNDAALDEYSVKSTKMHVRRVQE